ncbi:hypothetical protein CDAR_225911 [Caerostris darwini]|uniref:Uncharacterized protein n=1 Tax=Caerostris darwini TaxID=1538125 RepID=A0AAV4M4D2_9ARAC|nr:hypothetical protein CDAR_225911 [Caerostris darwini]
MEDGRYCHSPRQSFPPNKLSHIYSAGIFMYTKRLIRSRLARVTQVENNEVEQTIFFPSFFFFSPGIGDCFRAPSGFDDSLRFLFKKKEKNAKNMSCLLKNISNHSQSKY